MLKRKSDQLNALKAVPLFASLSDRDLKAVLAACREEVYSNGQAIVREGTPGGPFFLIVEGHAKLRRRWQGAHQSLGRAATSAKSR